MLKYATKESPIYLQIYLDKNFILGQKKVEFRKYIEELRSRFRNGFIYVICDWIEGTDEKHSYGISINSSEHYWTMGWAKANAKSWIDYLPLPKKHAKMYNEKYIEENKADYLMLDFVE